MKSYHKGLDIFTPEPGKEPFSKVCLVCKSELVVERNVNDATSWAEAMGKGKHLHDVWKCPLADHDWHFKAAQLSMRLREEKFPSLRKLMEEDIKDIVRKERKYHCLKCGRKLVQQTLCSWGCPHCES